MIDSVVERAARDGTLAFMLYKWVALLMDTATAVATNSAILSVLDILQRALAYSAILFSLAAGHCWHHTCHWLLRVFCFGFMQLMVFVLRNAHIAARIGNGSDRLTMSVHVCRHGGNLFNAALRNDQTRGHALRVIHQMNTGASVLFIVRSQRCGLLRLRSCCHCEDARHARALWSLLDEVADAIASRPAQADDPPLDDLWMRGTRGCIVDAMPRCLSLTRTP